MSNEFEKIDHEEGEGKEATAGSPIVVHYTGWLFDADQPDNKGEKFDSSLDRNDPFSFNLGAGQVSGQQVRGELNAVKVTLDQFAEALDGAGLGQAGRAFHQQVAIAEQGDEHAIDQGFLADDLLADVLFEQLNIFLI